MDHSGEHDDLKETEEETFQIGERIFAMDQEAHSGREHSEDALSVTLDATRKLFR